MIDVNGDRYEGKKSTKESTRKARNAKATAKSKESKKKIKKTAVEKVIDRETKLPSNQRVQLLLGTDLIQNAPQTKTITVSGVYEDPEDIRSNKCPDVRLASLCHIRNI